MFRADYIDKIYLHYPKATFITVRANKDGLQFCVFTENEKTGGLTILHEGNLPIGRVQGFRLKHKKEG